MIMRTIFGTFCVGVYERTTYAKVALYGEALGRQFLILTIENFSTVALCVFLGFVLHPSFGIHKLHAQEVLTQQNRQRPWLQLFTRRGWLGSLFYLQVMGIGSWETNFVLYFCIWPSVAALLKLQLRISRAWILENLTAE